MLNLGEIRRCSSPETGTSISACGVWGGVLEVVWGGVLEVVWGGVLEVVWGGVE